MKKFWKYQLCLLVSVFIFSCEKKDMSIANETESPYVYINGLKAVKPNHLTQADFIEPSLNTMFKDVKFGDKIKNLRVFGTDDERVKELHKFITEEKQKHPDLSIIPMQKSDVNRVLKDFPTLKNENDILENSNEILAYYNASVRKAISKKYNVSNAKVSGIIDDFFQFQLYLGLMAGVNLLDIYLAANDAGDHTFDRYGTNRSNGVNDNNVNIFEHSLWNCYAIRYMLITGRSKSGAIDLMAQVATAWELRVHDSEDDMFGQTNAVMDLKNNLEARCYMQDEVKWGIWVFRRWPNREEIRAAIGARTDITTGYTIKSSASEILGMFSSDARNKLKSGYNYDNRTFVAISTSHYSKL